nr:carboxymuconolactone decarboxylase family protein [Candidatus Freyarchaeota archaeon]
MNLDEKTVKLVGLGASIAANCQPCTEYHLKIARDSGITKEEINETMRIATAVKTNAAKVLAEFAKKLLNEEIKEEETTPEQVDAESLSESSSDVNCGCGCR